MTRMMCSSLAAALIFAVAAGAPTAEAAKKRVTAKTTSSAPAASINQDNRRFGAIAPTVALPIAAPASSQCSWYSPTTLGRSSAAPATSVKETTCRPLRLSKAIRGR